MTEAEALDMLTGTTDLDRYARELRREALDADRFLVVAVCDIALIGRVTKQCYLSLRAGEVRLLVQRLSCLGEHGRQEARKILEEARSSHG